AMYVSEDGYIKARSQDSTDNGPRKAIKGWPKPARPCPFTQPARPDSARPGPHTSHAFKRGPSGAQRSYSLMVIDVSEQHGLGRKRMVTCGGEGLQCLNVRTSHDGALNFPSHPGRLGPSSVRNDAPRPQCTMAYPNSDGFFEVRLRFFVTDVFSFVSFP
ncbi:hypothetical protein JZ751_028593, partial [Albula glossodonta]